MAPAGFVSFKNTHQTHPFSLKLQQRRQRRHYKPQLSLFLWYFRSQEYFFELNLVINTILWGWEAVDGIKVRFSASLLVSVGLVSPVCGVFVEVDRFVYGIFTQLAFDNVPFVRKKRFVHLWAEQAQPRKMCQISLPLRKKSPTGTLLEKIKLSNDSITTIKRRQRHDRSNTKFQTLCDNFIYIPSFCLTEKWVFTQKSMSVH